MGTRVCVCGAGVAAEYVVLTIDRSIVRHNAREGTHPPPAEERNKNGARRLIAFGKGV